MLFTKLYSTIIVRIFLILDALLVETSEFTLSLSKNAGFQELLHNSCFEIFSS